MALLPKMLDETRCIVLHLAHDAYYESLPASSCHKYIPRGAALKRKSWTLKKKNSCKELHGENKSCKRDYISSAAPSLHTHLLPFMLDVINIYGIGSNSDLSKISIYKKILCKGSNESERSFLVLKIWKACEKPQSYDTKYNHRKV